MIRQESAKLLDVGLIPTVPSIFCSETGDPMKKIIVCGGRDLPVTRQWVQRVAEKLKEIKATLVISGCARGGDAIGEAAAISIGLPIEKHPAQWDKWGKRAGYLRNVEMLACCDGTLSLPGGKGTEMMKKITLEAKKPLWVLE